MRQIKLITLFSFVLIMSDFFLNSAFARSPLGIGVAEQPINDSSIFSPFYIYILSWQQSFEQTIRGYLIGIKDAPYNAIWLIGLSFIYGIFHAAGPGHGKAVISSYLLANDASLKRGILLSFLSSISQALVAIFIILLIFFLLPGRLTQATQFLVTGSFILVMALGILMIWRKIKPYFQKKTVLTDIFENTSALANNHSPNNISSFASSSNIKSKPGLNYKKGEIHHRFKGDGTFCIECGQAHIISPDLVKEPLQLRSAFITILAVGLRPCSGALFVMSFVMLNNLWFIGVLSVLAMALGTFITVSFLAILAVYAKSLALKITNRESHFKLFKSILEWAGAIFIFLMGFSLTITSVLG